MPNDYVRMRAEDAHQVSVLAKKIDDLRRQLPDAGRDQTDRDAVEFSRVQALYSPVYDAVSDGLPPIKADERPKDYRLRLLGNLRDVYGFGGQRWKNEPLGWTQVASESGFNTSEEQILADAAARANFFAQGELVKDTDSAETRDRKENSLRQTSYRDQSGRPVHEYSGSPRSWIQYFSGASVKRLGWPPLNSM